MYTTSMLLLGLPLSGIVLAQEAAEPSAVQLAETNVKQLVAVLKGLNDLLATVKDKESADAAAPEMLKLAERMDEIKQASKKLAVLPPEEQKRLDGLYLNTVSKYLHTYIAHMKQISDKEFFGSETLRKAFVTYGKPE